MQTNQKGVIGLVLIVLILLAGVALGIYLISQKTNLFPKASISAPLGPESSITLVADENKSYNVGDNIPVTIAVRSDFDNFNLIKAHLSFPQDLLEVVSYTKDTTVIRNWVEEYFDSTSASFSGGIPDPGYKTTAGNNALSFVTVTFRAKSPGSATINVDNDSAIYRNSDNQNVLAKKVGTTLAIGDSAQPTPTPNNLPTKTVNLLPAAGRYTPGNSGTAKIEPISIDPDSIGLTVKISGELNGLKPSTVYKVYLCLIDSYLSCSTNATPINRTDSVGRVVYTVNQFYIRDPSAKQSYYVKVVEQPEPGPVPSNLCTTDKPCMEAIYQVFGTTSPTPTPTPTPSPTPASTPLPGTGDGNRDGKTDLIDMSVLLTLFNKSTANPVDMNGDGLINTFDFALLRQKLIDLRVIRIRTL